MSIPRRPDLGRLAAPRLWVALLPVLLAGCEAEAVELAQDVVAARGDCSPEGLKASDEECVRMMERYAEMGTELVHTYLGGLKALDRALDRMPPPSFDTAGFGYAISPELRGGDPYGPGASPRLRAEGAGEYHGPAAQPARLAPDQARGSIMSSATRAPRALGEGRAWGAVESSVRRDAARVPMARSGAYPQDPVAFRGTGAAPMYGGPAGAVADRRGRADREWGTQSLGPRGWGYGYGDGFGIFESGPYGYFYGAPYDYGYGYGPYAGAQRGFGYGSTWGGGLDGYGYDRFGRRFDARPYSYRGDPGYGGYGDAFPERYGYLDPYGRVYGDVYGGYGRPNGYVDPYAYGAGYPYDERFRRDPYEEEMYYDRRGGEMYGSGEAAPRDGWGYAPVESAPEDEEGFYEEVEPRPSEAAPAPARPAPHRPGILLPPEERLRRPWLDYD